MAAYCDRVCSSLYMKSYTGDGSSVIRNMLEHFKIFYNFNCIVYDKLLNLRQSF